MSEGRNPPKGPVIAREAIARAPARRFYQEAKAVPRAGGIALTLDGRTARTPAKAPLVVPAAALGEALAAEWQAQGSVIDPAAMPLTRLVNSAIDGVYGREAEVVADICAYAASDLLCYRAEAPQELVARQAAAWDPVLAWARQALGVRVVLGAGVMPVRQPEAVTEKVGAALAGRDAFRLASLHALTTLMGSALLALAVERGRLAIAAAWAAAHVDEDWQSARWGEDEEAAARRAARRREAEAAARLIALAG
jgi:chaperone required for assembly of F1-ATPase